MSNEDSTWTGGEVGGLPVGQVKNQVGKSLTVLPQLALLRFRVMQVSPEAVLLVEVWGGGPACCLAVAPQLLQCPFQPTRSLFIISMSGMISPHSRVSMQNSLMLIWLMLLPLTSFHLFYMVVNPQDLGMQRAETAVTDKQAAKWAATFDL